MAWRAIPGPLSKRKRSLDSLEAAQGAPRDPRCDSSNSRDFTVETSLDGETWTTVGTHVGNTAPVTDASITPVEARYVRVTVTDGGSDGFVRIGDIEVYGAH